MYESFFLTIHSAGHLAIAGIDDIFPLFRINAAAQGLLQSYIAGPVAGGNNCVVKHKCEAAHQTSQHQGRQHEAGRGHANAAQGREFTAPGKTAVGQQGGHQRGHREGEHQEARQLQQQHLQGHIKGQAGFRHLAHQFKHHPHGKGDGGEGRHTEEQRGNQLSH